MSYFWNNRHALRAACALCLFGAAQGCPVDQDALFVDVCKGAHTNCDPKLETKSVGTRTPLTCEPETGAALEVDWESEVTPTDCMAGAPGDCQVGLNSIAVDQDGAAWVVTNFETSGDPAMADRLPYGVWLARYAADGKPTAGVTVIEGPNPTGAHVQYRPDVTVTRTGHALVTAYAIAAKSADAELEQSVVLAEYEKDGTLVGKAITLLGIAGTHVAAASDGSAVIASNAAHNKHHGVLAEVGSGGALHFSQNGLETYGQAAGAGVSGVSVNHQDRISVLMARSPEDDSPTQRLAFSQFDRRGNVIWERILDTEFDDGWAQFGMDGDDDLVMLGHLPAADPGYEAPAMIEKLSASGELLFTMSLPADSGDHQLAVEPGGDNRIFVTTTAVGGGHVREISADGSRCVLHKLPNGSGMSRAAGRGGSLYYLVSAAGPDHPAHLGRLKPIENE